MPSTSKKRKRRRKEKKKRKSNKKKKKRKKKKRKKKTGDEERHKQKVGMWGHLLALRVRLASQTLNQVDANGTPGTPEVVLGISFGFPWE